MRSEEPGVRYSAQEASQVRHLYEHGAMLPMAGFGYDRFRWTSADGVWCTPNVRCDASYSLSQRRVPAGCPSCRKCAHHNVAEYTRKCLVLLVVFVIFVVLVIAPIAHTASVASVRREGRTGTRFNDDL